MSKLLAAFLASPTEQARARLQAYLSKHMMAVCLATPDEQAALRLHNFKG
jgi:hypothetical protein